MHSTLLRGGARPTVRIQRRGVAGGPVHREASSHSAADTQTAPGSPEYLLGTEHPGTQGWPNQPSGWGPKRTSDPAPPKALDAAIDGPVDGDAVGSDQRCADIATGARLTPTGDMQGPEAAFDFHAGLRRNGGG